MDIESAGVYQLLLETPAENVQAVATVLATIVELGDREFKRVLQDLSDIRNTADPGDREALVDEAVMHVREARGVYANQPPLFLLTA